MARKGMAVRGPGLAEVGALTRASVLTPAQRRSSSELIRTTWGVWNLRPFLDPESGSAFHTAMQPAVPSFAGGGR